MQGKGGVVLCLWEVCEWGRQVASTCRAGAAPTSKTEVVYLLSIIIIQLCFANLKSISKKILYFLKKNAIIAHNKKKFLRNFPRSFRNQNA